MDLSVVIPAFNEEHRIELGVRDVSQHLTNSGLAWELIVVDDGSTDSTARVVESIGGGVPELRLLQHESNQGKGAAIRTGLTASQGQRIIYLDADGATPFDQFQDCIRAMQRGADIAVGVRWGAAHDCKRSAARKLLGCSFAMLARGATGIRTADPQCGFKMLTRSALDRLLPHLNEVGYLLDIELLMLAAQLDLDVAEVPVRWNEISGSKINPVRDSVRMAWGLMQMRQRIANRFRLQEFAQE